MGLAGSVVAGLGPILYNRMQIYRIVISKHNQIKSAIDCGMAWYGIGVRREPNL